MPRRPTIQIKALVLVAILLAVWWLLPVALKQGSRRIFQEFQAPSWVALGSIRDLQTFWAARTTSKDDLIAAGRDLARQNAAYELRLLQADETAAELERLERLLRMPASPDFHYEVARVVRRDLNAWWQQIVIRKGSHHGIAPGYPVVYERGVVGRVREVQLYTATVELLSSPGFRVAAHFVGDNRPVQFQGGINPGLFPARGRATTVPADLSASGEKPLTLVTSRLGGVFPDGLLLGQVTTLEPGPDGLFQSAFVRLDEDLQGLREVAVLIPVETTP